MASGKEKQKHKGIVRFTVTGYVNYDRNDIGSVTPAIASITAALESVKTDPKLSGVKVETCLSTMPIEGG